MRIIFICGCLEPGCDGVGDYTRKFAAELTLQGHQVALIALYDPFVTKTLEDDQHAGNTLVRTLRIAANDTNAFRFSIARKMIKTFVPDLLSLQFVAFSFHPKGLSLSLNRHLKMLGKGITWHIMFHELWVGMAKNDTLKRKLWGRGQKLLITNLVKTLKPAVIHSQCEPFLSQLNKRKYGAKKLPLFSNIDVYNTDISDKLNHLSLTEKKARFVFFGGLHPDAKLEQLISKLKEIEKKSQKQFEFIYIGRNGQGLASYLPILKREGVKYEVLGELSPKDISAVLSTSTIGISTGSPQFLEKNGTVAAMVAHKLPIVCIGRDYVLEDTFNVNNLKGIYFLDDLEQLLSYKPVPVHFNTISDVVKQFVAETL